MSGEREQRLVFGEVAEQYDARRPSYPDALFDAVCEYGDLHAGARALEIGAGTGKATVGMLARGLDVHALEPSAEMARVLRGKGVDAEVTTLEAWTVVPDAFDLVYAAQAWHWVHGADRYERVAGTLRPGGTLALFWNKGREHDDAFAADNRAAYATYAPDLGSPAGSWTLDWIGEELAACDMFTAMERRTFTWTTSYSRDAWLALLATHSDHRMLPDARRAQLHVAVGEAIDKHGGAIDIVYDTELFLARRDVG